MDQYVGLDVALKETSIPVRQNRKRIWRGKCLSDPQLVAEMIRKHAPYAGLVVFETGPPTWFHRKLTTDGLKAADIDARHAKAARDTASHRPTPTTPMGCLFSQRPVSSGRFAAKALRRCGGGH
jgi:transposase